MAVSAITIVGLNAFGGSSQNVLQWAVNDPNIEGLPYLKFDHAEVRAAATVDMAGAVTLTGSPATAYAHTPIERGEKYFYQVRAVDRSGQFGAWCAAVSATEISGDVLIAVNGYWRLPNGLILQWGHTECDINGLATVTYPRPFPNYVFSTATAVIINVPGTFSVAVSPDINYLQYFSALGSQTTGAGTVPSPALEFGWLAIGF